jgi:hypothetical protein
MHKLQEKPSSLNRELFFTFVGHFGHPGSGSVFPVRIQIQPTKMNADPDPQHCFKTSLPHPDPNGYFLKLGDLYLLFLTMGPV